MKAFILVLSAFCLIGCASSQVAGKGGPRGIASSAESKALTKQEFMDVLKAYEALIARDGPSVSSPAEKMSRDEIVRIADFHYCNSREDCSAEQRAQDQKDIQKHMATIAKLRQSKDGRLKDTRHFIAALDKLPYSMENDMEKLRCWQEVDQSKNVSVGCFFPTIKVSKDHNANNLRFSVETKRYQNFKGPEPTYEVREASLESLVDQFQ